MVYGHGTAAVSSPLPAGLCTQNASILCARENSCPFGRHHRVKVLKTSGAWLMQIVDSEEEYSWKSAQVTNTLHDEK